MKAGIFIVLLNISSIITLAGKNYNLPFFEENVVDSLENNSLYFKLNSETFLKNNEYFGDFSKGMTITGFKIIPFLSYKAKEKTEISIGMMLQKYSSYNNLNKSIPLFRIEHKPNNNINLIGGKLYSNLNHKLIEPLYGFDNYFFNNVEEGIQFIFNYPRIKSDIWIDWEQFILWNDPFQEKFTFGTSNSLNVIKPGNQNLNVDLQSLISHRGGQITSLDTNIQNLINVSPGLNYSFYFNEKTILSVFAYMPVSIDASPNKETKYENGIGYYPGIKLIINNFHIHMAYWNAYRFYGHKGEALYNSGSSYDNTLFHYNRQLLNFRFRYSLLNKSGFKLAAGLETFYDLKTNKLEYNYSIYLRFEDFFHIKTISKK